MRVVKRNGESQAVNFEKIHWRIKAVCATPDILEFQKENRPDAYLTNKKLEPLFYPDVDTITKKTIEGLYDGMSTGEIDILSSEIAQEMISKHYENSILAKRLLVSNIQKNTFETLSKRFPNLSRDTLKQNIFRYTMEALYFNRNKKGELAPLIAPYLLKIARKYSQIIEEKIDWSRDFTNHGYIGIKTLERGYLMRGHDIVGVKEKDVMLERPQSSDMRVAIGIHCSPTPCPPPYPKRDVMSVIKKFVDVIKDKYVNEPYILENIEKEEQPHKSKYIDRKIFKERYWRWKLLEDIEVEPTTFDKIFATYEQMSTGKYTPATPARFSVGTLRPQASSCFLIAMESDSLQGIYNTLSKQAAISKYAGGVGMWTHNIRSQGSYIEGTNGHSNGLKTMLRVFNASTQYVDQGGGKRAGATAVYLEPWHADIISFLSMKRFSGEGRSMFYAMWLCDEFFRSLKYSKDWYLFDPAMCPKLFKCYDEKFSDSWLNDEEVNKTDYAFTYRYRKYIRQGRWEKKISASKIIQEIVHTLKESGQPYMLCKDTANRKSNQKNLGTICSSNLCTEIIEYSDSEETACCNLSSLCLNKFVRPWREEDGVEFKYNTSIGEDGKLLESYHTFDFEQFAETVRVVQNNLDRTIDFNFYPTECTRRSNMKHRPMGIGVQGEADMMAKLRLRWEGKEAQRLRFYIFERLYYECCKASNELAKKDKPYFSFTDSPASQSFLQFDLWLKEGKKMPFALSLDWSTLKDDIQKHGLRNSLFIAPMPTASTSYIMGNSPSIEPFNSMIWNRKSNTGDITLVNRGLVEDLQSLGLWSENMKDRIVEQRGSIQEILEIPKLIRDIYKTAFDLEAKHIVDAAYMRGWFVDQSQSMNLFIKNVTEAAVTKAWTRGWRKGLKTLSYYTRTQVDNFDINKSKKVDSKKDKADDFDKFEGKVCNRDDPDCLSCGS